jgi:hypothetical protein
MHKHGLLGTKPVTFRDLLVSACSKSIRWPCVRGEPAKGCEQNAYSCMVAAQFARAGSKKRREGGGVPGRTGGCVADGRRRDGLDEKPLRGIPNREHRPVDLERRDFAVGLPVRRQLAEDLSDQRSKLESVRRAQGDEHVGVSG